LQLSGYSDPNVSTEWYLKDKDAITWLAVPTELKSWVSGLAYKEMVLNIDSKKGEWTGFMLIFPEEEKLN
jgi:hypothetical protein